MQPTCMPRGRAHLLHVSLPRWRRLVLCSAWEGGPGGRPPFSPFIIHSFLKGALSLATMSSAPQEGPSAP
eukprot:158899-Chlamydomonas_euryale.AAC.1